MAKSQGSVWVAFGERAVESYTIKRTSGELEGPYGLRVIRAFVVSGKYQANDTLMTADGDIPLASHPSLQDLWQSTKEKKQKSNAPPPKPKGRVVLFQGRVLPPGANPDYAGSLAKNPLVKLMYNFCLTRQTGRLHLRSGRQTVDLFLEYGIPRYITSNNPATRLGELLVHEGILSRQEHDTLMKQGSGQPLGQLLLAYGRMTPTQIQDALTLQFKRRFFTALGWKDNAVYRFYNKQISGEDFPIAVVPWHLLKEGVMDWMPIARIQDELLPFRNRLVIRQIHPKLKFEDFQLTSEEYTFLSGVTQEDPLNDVVGDAVERGLLTEEHAQRLIYLMMHVMFLRMGEERLGARTKRQIAELGTYIETLQQQNRLQRLGLSGGASATEIRRAYLKLAKQYHPDHLPPNTHPEVAKTMSVAFSLIADAYRVLSG